MTDIHDDGIAQIQPGALRAGHLWAPVVGTEFRALKQKMPPGSSERIESEAMSVLAKCVPPTSPQRSEIGLAIGCVQSGKTMNFTTVCAIARDNDYQLVVLITGTSLNLYAQSTSRVIEQLELENRTDRAWVPIKFDVNMHLDPIFLNGVLNNWKIPGRSKSKKSTIIITVLKHHQHLEQLVSTLQGVNLVNIPSLIIDDEADQAGLNSGAASGRESSTYRQLLALRDVIPHHTYLQYTATPQAPLLINIIDALSPSFVEVLSPGNGYTGGREFFLENPHATLRSIPQAEIWTTQNQLRTAPESFQISLASFLVACAAGELGSDDESYRSMLIHPHQATVPHAIYYNWVSRLRDEWTRILSNKSDPDHLWLTDLIKSQHIDLSRTYTIPPLENIIENIASLLGTINIQQINAVRGKTPAVEWARAYAHILVGGQAMDRGYTVRGLTTTYMPRSLGGGNADTLQQRARFFGYKEKYFGLCRVWLEQGALDAFTEYVTHEESIRRELTLFVRTGKNLKEWKRAFFLDLNLRPTRRQVLTLPFFRGNHGGDWVFQRRPHDVPELMRANNKLIENYLIGMNTVPDPGDPNRTRPQIHGLIDGLRLSDVYSSLLAEIRITDPNDSNDFTGLLLQIRFALDDDPELLANIYIMSPNDPRTRTRRPVSDEIYPFQGANLPAYPGDQAIRVDDRVCIQVHHYAEVKPDDQNKGGELFKNVKLIAVYLPLTMGRDYLVQ